MSAAESLREVMAEAARAYESGGGGVIVELNTGGSGALLQQALRGAPVDVLVVASSDELERLERAGRAAGPAVAFATNRLVVAVPRGAPAPAGLADLAGPAYRRIAVGSPATAPVGRYARQALGSAGLLPALEPRLVQAGHARQVLGWLVRGEVDAAVLYLTDARVEPERATLAFEIDAALHDPIGYSAVPLRDGRAEAAGRFIAWLGSEPAQRILAAHGFGPAEGR